jgi:hypothetical protein
MVRDKDSLVVLWTSGDPEVAMKMVFMYTLNAKLQGWWKEVSLIVWGPSAKILSENEGLQKSIRKMKDVGVILEACKACADLYHVSPKLKNLGINVRYMGQTLTDYLKDDDSVVLAI